MSQFTRNPKPEYVPKSNQMFSKACHKRSNHKLDISLRLSSIYFSLTHQFVANKAADAMPDDDDSSE